MASGKVLLSDANTVALWLFNETTHIDAVDEITTSPGFGINLIESGAAPPFITGPLIIPGGSKGRFFRGSTNGHLKGTTQPTGLELVLQGACSYETIITQRPEYGSAAAICRYVPLSGDPAEAFNEQISMQLSGTRKIKIDWETGASTPVTYTTTAEMWTAEGSADAHYLAVTKTAGGVWKFYVDAVLIETSGTLTNPTGGTSGSQRWSLGEADGYGAGTWLGHMDEFRISNKERTQAEITASDDRWDVLRGGGTVVDSTAPVIQNMVPTAGGNITPTQTWVFEVYDASPGFRYLEVLVTIGGTECVVHDGTNFIGAYTDSTRTGAGTSGSPYIYTIRRTGGWTGSPTFRVEAIDQNGNKT